MPYDLHAGDRGTYTDAEQDRAATLLEPDDALAEICRAALAAILKLDVFDPDMAIDGGEIMCGTTLRQTSSGLDDLTEMLRGAAEPSKAFAAKRWARALLAAEEEADDWSATVADDRHDAMKHEAA